MPTLERLNTAALRESVRTFRDTVREHAHGLNRLNVYPVPDGDTGTNMARTLDAVVAEMETAADDDHDATCDAISYGSLMGARGNSGVILSQIMRGFAGTLKHQADVQGAKFAEALQAAAAGAYEAVLKPIEGTILTVCRESAEAAKVAADAGGSLAEVVRAARAAGKTALDNTPEQLQVLKDAGVVDAGGAGFLLLLDSVLHVVDGEPLPVAEPDDGTMGAVGAAFDAVAHRHAAAPGELDVSEQRYEVMYFLDLADERIRDFKSGWGAIGDSIVVVGGDGLWNCHVHTNDIGAAIEVALDLGGRPKAIRVSDLFEEIDEEHAKREAELAATAHDAPVAVASAGGDDRGRRHLLGRRSRRVVRPTRCAGRRHRWPDDESVDCGTPRVGTAGECRSGRDPAEQQEHHPGRRTGRGVDRQDRRGRADALDARRLSPHSSSTTPRPTPAATAGEMTEAAESVVTGEVTQAVRDSKSPVGAVERGRLDRAGAR